MQLDIHNSRITSILFPDRKLRNPKEQNWKKHAKKQKIFLEKQSVSLDGSDGNVIIKYKLEPYLKKKIESGEIKFSGVYFPENLDPEINSILEASDRTKLNGQTIYEADPIELIQAGILKL